VVLDIDNRRAGVLQAVSALSGQGPTGDLDAAMPFIDWLVEAGVGLWQILPLVPTDKHGSPYSSDSALSGNPDLVGIEFCIDAGLLRPEDRLAVTQSTDYPSTRRLKRPLILTAAQALLDQPDHPWRSDLARFESEALWATDAAVFRALNITMDGAGWWTWPEPLRRADPRAVAEASAAMGAEISLWRTALYLFERQWSEVRRYAAARGVLLIGDMPIYVGLDSVDVWMNQGLFQLKPDGRPKAIAGVPPDAYSDTGQYWRNPLFDWDAMAEQGWTWWVARCERMLAHCDALRIDHFIGFDRYWSIPEGTEDARRGEWCEGPGRALFDVLKESLGGLPFIAEDLGDVAPSTHALRDSIGLPGMRVALFGYDGEDDNIHHPSQYPRRSVAYTSTHDSPPLLGWLGALSGAERSRGGLGEAEPAEVSRLVDDTLASESFWAILPLQDVLGLGGEARMNTPGTEDGNWTWRLVDGQLTGALALQLRRRIQESGRLIS